MNSNIVKVIHLVPGKVSALRTVEANALSENEFWTEFIRTHEPVLIKNAVASWPALQRWQLPGYLEALCDDETAGMSRTFNAQPALPYFEFGVKNKHKRLADCLAEMRSAADDVTYSIPGQGVPEQWKQDLGRYSFLSERVDQKPRLYRRQRLFIYKNASTEWHCHPTDETITTQLLGAKHVSLFRLTPDNWRLYSQLIHANLHHLACSTEFFPREPTITKYECILEAGDAVYIPPFWWHGIDPVDAALGMTLAHCFRTPLRRLGDWKEPVTKETLQDLIVFRRKRYIPLVLAMIACSSLSRKLAGEPWLPVTGAAQP